MSKELRAGPRALLHKPRPLLGRAVQTHRHPAGAPHRLQVSLHREGNEGWRINRDEALLQGKQSLSPRLQPQGRDHLHPPPRRKQPLRLGHEPVSPSRQLLLAAQYADRGANQELAARRKEGLHPRGGLGVPPGAA